MTDFGSESRVIPSDLQDAIDHLVNVELIEDFTEQIYDREREYAVDGGYDGVPSIEDLPMAAEFVSAVNVLKKYAASKPKG